MYEQLKTEALNEEIILQNEIPAKRIKLANDHYSLAAGGEMENAIWNLNELPMEIDSNDEEDDFFENGESYFIEEDISSDDDHDEKNNSEAEEEEEAQPQRQ